MPRRSTSSWLATRSWRRRSFTTCARPRTLHAPPPSARRPQRRRGRRRREARRARRLRGGCRGRGRPAAGSAGRAASERRISGRKRCGGRCSCPGAADLQAGHLPLGYQGLADGSMVASRESVKVLPWLTAAWCWPDLDRGPRTGSTTTATCPLSLTDCTSNHHRSQAVMALNMAQLYMSGLTGSRELHSVTLTSLAHAGGSPSGLVPGSPVAAQLLAERASSGGRGPAFGSPLSPAGLGGSPADLTQRRASGGGRVPVAAAAVEACRSPAPAAERPRDFLTPGSGSASVVRRD